MPHPSSHGPRTVEALAVQAGQPVANASHHLRALRAARLVETEKHGLYVTYRLADERVAALLVALRALATDQLSELRALTEHFLARRGALEPIDRDALLERLQAGDVTVIDVRPPEEYRAGHLPGALSIPLSDLEQRLGELPRDQEVVAYCRGPYCVMAIDAVAQLRAHGFQAVRWDEGIADWQARGLPVERETA